MSIYDNAKNLADKLIDKFANPSILTIEEQSVVSDGMGGDLVTWVTKFTCSGAVIESGRAGYSTSTEVLKAMQLSPESTHIAYIKHGIGEVLSSNRIVFKGSVYNITGNALNIASADAVLVIPLKKGVVT